MKPLIAEAVTDLAALVLLIFCSAGVYSIFIRWWHDPSFAGICAFVVPAALFSVALLSSRLRSAKTRGTTEETNLEDSETHRKWNAEEKLVEHIDKRTVFRDYIHRGWTVQQIEEAIAKYSSLEKAHSIKATLEFVNKIRGAFGLDAMDDLPTTEPADFDGAGRGPIWKALEPIGCDYLNRWAIYFKTAEAARGAAWATGAQYYDSIHSRAIHPAWEIGQVQMWWEAGNLPEYCRPVQGADPDAP